MAPSDVTKQVAARLKQARKELGLTLKQAAEAFGFGNYQTLSEIEKGGRAVKTSELVRFAKLYERSIDFFLAQEEPTARPSVAWRDRADSPATKVAERRFLTYCSNYARLEELSGRKPATATLDFHAQVTTWHDAVQLGKDTRAKMKMGSRPALELRDILEERYGVKLLMVEMPDAGSAAAARDSFGTGILTNAGNAPWRISYDIAHELFHLLTWNQSETAETNTTGTEKPLTEKYADKFASVLLLPEDSLGEEFRSRLKDGKLSYMDCVTMAREFGVSTAALLWRLVGLGLVKKQEVEKALESDALRQIDRTERRPDWANRPGGRPSRRFVAVAFECLMKGLISRGRFANLMRIRRGEVGQFLSEYGYDETEDYVGQISTA